MRIKWLGEASFEIEAGESTIHVDPHLIPQAAGKADLVLLTHDHLTHADEQGILAVRKKETLAVATDRAAERLGLASSIVYIGERILYRDVTATAVPAYVLDSTHHQRGHGVGYVIESEGKKIYHAGITEFIPEMHLLDEVDLMILPIGPHNPLTHADIVGIAQKVDPEILAPVYYALTEASFTDLASLKLSVESSSSVRVEDIRLHELHL
ncbi:MAG: MBL fold metallo-hydrolase [Candidatus Altiarchaeota archaeon]